MASKKPIPVKCKLCEKKLVSKAALIDHIGRVHASSIPEGWSPARYENYLRTGKTEGRCVECHKKTTWNETTGKYNRMCGSEECKKKARERANKNYIGLHGKPYSINNPEQQAKMIYGRKNSGTYVFEDENTGKEYKAMYDSSYGKDFLEMIDALLNWPGQDVIAPSPHTYWYEYNGEKHFYMPDVYLASINTEVELKDGGDNPNNHPKIQAVDKVKEVAKDKVMESIKDQVNYIKICNKDYKDFFAMLSRLKAQDNCPLPKWESRLEPITEEESHLDVCRPTDHKNLSEKFNAYHLDEHDHDCGWDEELYSTTLDQEVKNVLSSVSRKVPKGKIERYVFTMGYDNKAVLLGKLIIYWHCLWDPIDMEFDYEWESQEEFNESDIDAGCIVTEGDNPLVSKKKANLARRYAMLVDPMLNYDDLLLYYRKKIFYERPKKTEWVALYSELENVRDHLKCVINGNSENDVRMKYEAKKALKEVEGFLSYMDDVMPTLESTYTTVSETKEYSDKLDRAAILKELRSFAKQYSKIKWRVGYKAALVLYGIFSETNDIDILARDEVCDDLIAKGCKHVPAPYGGERITVTDRLEVFNNECDIPPKKIDGFYVDDIDEIYRCYERMNREKDQETLRRIEAYKRGKTTVYESAEWFVFESRQVSKLDPNYSGKELFSLSDYRKVQISKEVLNKYKGRYSFLKHIREDDGGAIWFDGENVVAVCGIAPHKETTDQSQMWIHSFEISSEYRNHGLARQIMDVAVKEYHAQYLSVAKKNEVAIDLYKKYGFEVYGENKTTYFMKLRGASEPEFVPLDESAQPVAENVLIPQKNLEVNLDKWDVGTPLWITGTSGDGKSTLAIKMAKEHDGAIILHTDLFLLRVAKPKEKFDKITAPDHNNQAHPLNQYGMEYIKAHPEIPYDLGYTDKMNQYMIGFLRWIVEACQTTYPYNKKFVIVEGSDINLLGADFLSQQPLIIIGCSRMQALWRRIKREHADGTAWVDASIKVISKYNKVVKPLDDNKERLWREIVARESTEPVEESVLISREDIRVNFQDWKPGKHNVLLVTGLSGSGKTTTSYELAYEYRAEVFQLDWIDNPQYMQDSQETPNYGLWQYVKSNCRNSLKKLQYAKDFETRHGVIDQVFSTILVFAKMHSDKLFIVEGIQIPGMLRDYPGIDKFPVIIKGTSIVHSMARRFGRDGSDMFRNMNGNILQWYYDIEYNLNNYRGRVTTVSTESFSEVIGSEVLEAGAMSGVTYGYSPTDAEDIVNTMTDKEREYIGHPKGEKFFWESRVFYKEILYVNKVPAAFIKVYTTYTKKDTAHLVLATKKEYRKNGYAKLLISRFAKARKPAEIKYVEYGYDNWNRSSAKLAQSSGFHHMDKVEGGHSATKPIESLEATRIEAFKDELRYFPIFVFLTYTGSWIGKVIKAYTHDPYSHASLSFDTKLTNMFSFTAEGFTNEDITVGEYNEVKKGKYSLYMYMANASEFDAIRAFVNALDEKRAKLKYNILGLTNFIFGRGSEREDRFFCSEFVAAAIAAGNEKILTTKTFFTKPYTFAKNKNFIFIKRGELGHYNPTEVDKIIAGKLKEGGFHDVIFE